MTNALPMKERSAVLRGGLAAGAALLLALVVKLAAGVTNGVEHAFDKRIMLSLREPGNLADPIGPGWFEEMMRDFTALGGNGFLTLLTLLAAAVMLIHGRRREALVFLAAVVAALVIGNLMKLGVARPRPELVPHQTHVYTASFPSSHAAMSAAIYLSLAAVAYEWPARRAVRRLALATAVLLTFLVGFSRIYLGVHWPTDVIAGWSFGTATAIACWLALVHLHHGPTEPPGD